MIENIKPIEDGEEEFVSIEEALEKIDKYKPPKVQKSKEKPKPNKLERHLVILDDKPAKKGDKKIQDDWITYWNKRKDGRIFASMPDLYQAFKQMKSLYDNGTVGECKKASRFVFSLRKDFDFKKDNMLLTSTRIIYQPDNLEAEIIHHYGNKNFVVKSPKITIPHYEDWIRLPGIMEDKVGRAFLKALFNTKDNIETIMDTLKFTSPFSREQIAFPTPPLESSFYTIRSEESERAVGLFHFVFW